MRTKQTRSNKCICGTNALLRTAYFGTEITSFENLRLGNKRCGRSTGDDAEQVVPAADDSAAVELDHLLERHRHLLLDGARVVHVSGDVEELRPGVPGAAEAGEPVSAAAADGGRHGHGLDVGDGGGAAEDADVSGEWRLQSRLALLALEGLDERGLLAADVGAGAAVHEDVKVVAGAAGVLAQEALSIGLFRVKRELRQLVVARI